MARVKRTPTLAGLCECGCGGVTSLASRNIKSRGWVRGQHVRFIHNHHRVGHVGAMLGRIRELSPSWKGGRWIGEGYAFVRIEDDHPFASMGRRHSTRGSLYVREHRLVMATHLGRPLAPEEQVHHIDEDKLNNRIENLQLFATAAEHSRHHMGIR